MPKLIPRNKQLQASAPQAAMPALIDHLGPRGRRRYVEFFTAQIRNPNTRSAYARAVRQFFDWCDHRGLHHLGQLEPTIIAAYVESHPGSKPTIKQHLAALRMLFDWFVTGHVLEVNPATSVRGPKYTSKKGKTPVLDADQARALLDSIDTRELIGLRDRALISVMVYTFARVSAVIGMAVEDYYPDGKRWWFRLHEKGGKRHEVPAHHNAEAYVDAWLEAAGLADDKKTPLFRAMDRKKHVSPRPLHRTDVLAMVKRRAKAAGLPATISNHTFRATGITAYMNNGGTLEHAQQIAAHESARTTKLYDRTSDTIQLDEIEKIAI